MPNTGLGPFRRSEKQKVYTEMSKHANIRDRQNSSLFINKTGQHDRQSLELQEAHGLAPPPVYEPTSRGPLFQDAPTEE